MNTAQLISGMVRSEASPQIDEAYGGRGSGRPLHGELCRTKSGLGPLNSQNAGEANLHTAINDTYDFGVGKRLHNRVRPCEIGFAINRRLIGIECLSYDWISARIPSRPPSPRSPSVVRAPRARALLSSAFMHSYMLPSYSGSLPEASGAANLRRHLAALSGNDSAATSQGAVTHQLHRPRVHGLIERLPPSYRDGVTDWGLRIALFFTRTYNRLLLVPPRFPHWAPSPRHFSAPLTYSRSKSTRPSGRPRWSHRN